MKATADPYLGRSFGNVVLDARIGQGGMGTVYRGRHGRIDRDVAVKLLPPHHDEHRLQYQQRFLREGQTAARIQHRNVVQVLDAGKQHDVAYLVLEFVDGRAVGDLLDERTKLPPAMVEKLALDLARGLCAIHEAGVVHRDIKPDNLLLGTDGVLKITDLGLARSLDDPEINRLTATGMVVGTPLYVAPEAIRDAKNAGAKADIYGMGASLYHMLSGRPPFTGKTPYDVMRAHLDQRPEPLRELDSSIPRHLANLVHLCLSKDPAERPSATEVARILEQRHTVRDGSGRTTVVLIIAAMVAVFALAALAWEFVGKRAAPAAPTMSADGSTSIAFDLPYADLRYRIDGGEWVTHDGDRIALAPGRHQLQVEVRDRGRILRDHATIDLAAGEHRPLDLRPSPVEVPPLTYRFPEGAGIFYVRGEAVGSNELLTFQHLGTHPVVRFDGATFWSLTVTVDEQGLEAGTIAKSRHPPEDGYFRDRVDGVAAPLHHLCCWQEVEWARQAADMPAPSAWARGAQAPAQPAIDLDLRLLSALETWARDLDLRLPGRAEAERLHAAYRAPVWYREGGELAYHGGQSGRNALVALLPRGR